MTKRKMATAILDTFAEHGLPRQQGRAATLAAQGLSIHEIGVALGVHTKVAGRHVWLASKKLGVDSKIGLTKLMVSRFRSLVK